MAFIVHIIKFELDKMKNYKHLLNWFLFPWRLMPSNGFGYVAHYVPRHAA